MATIADISQTLGDYMLKGWVLTDNSCPTPGCTVPLLRSPKSTRTPPVTLCVKCDGNDDGNPFLSKGATAAAVSNSSADSNHSPLSTPPTEFSHAPGSPVFIPLEESPESRQRRAQSDQASSEIGKRLLKGWAMLGDECPNDSCYGVPLVRPPKAGLEKDPRKECVICGNVYITEKDWAGRENLVSFKTNSDELSASAQSQTGSSQDQMSTPPPIVVPFSSPFGRQVVSEHKKVPAEPIQHNRVMPSARETKSVPNLESSSPSYMELDETSQALQISLQALTGRLSALSSQSILDPAPIATTADAINKVALALGQIRRLQRDQT